jgi:hypothetical protein
MGLVAIAQEMKRRLAEVEKGHVVRHLFGGLMLVLERRGRTWRLAIGRIASPPSRTETAVVARDFGLPDVIEWSWTTRKNTKHKLTYQVAECQWIEEGNQA